MSKKKKQRKPRNPYTACIGVTIFIWVITIIYSFCKIGEPTHNYKCEQKYPHTSVYLDLVDSKHTTSSLGDGSYYTEYSGTYEGDYMGTHYVYKYTSGRNVPELLEVAIRDDDLSHMHIASYKQDIVGAWEVCALLWVFIGFCTLAIWCETFHVESRNKGKSAVNNGNK